MSTETIKYSDLLMDWLVEDGYTTCFFLGGGNVMHLLESASHRFRCIPVVHEVAAAIAAEYFNEAGHGRAFALVTAGPGLTNLVTGIAGAWLESRELLVIGGQARTDMLADGRVRQIGHQEIDGTGIVKPITKASIMIDRPFARTEVMNYTQMSRHGRKGPVFLEICLDVSGAMVQAETLIGPAPTTEPLPRCQDSDLNELLERFTRSERPLFLLGGGLARETARELESSLEKLGVPIATTWNGADRFPSSSTLYAGRPNVYGMRFANAVIQQADLIVAIGTRLGIQQVGFNHAAFAPLAEVVQVDLDAGELNKGFPRVDQKIHCDANVFLPRLLSILSVEISSRWAEWREFVPSVRRELPLVDQNSAGAGYIEPYRFLLQLSDCLVTEDVIVPCSSGGAFTISLQTIQQKSGQILITDKGLASMGYGLSGAIGAALARPNSRVIHIEGDGGFAQNLQELGTVARNRLNIKTFLFDNGGYASIKTMQKAYFSGHYVGCDESSGLSMPKWPDIFSAYGINCMRVNQHNAFAKPMLSALSSPVPWAFIVSLDPDQAYLPKLTSRFSPSGAMETSPLHLMKPDLSPQVSENVFRYLPPELRQ